MGTVVKGPLWGRLQTLEEQCERSQLTRRRRIGAAADSGWVRCHLRIRRRFIRRRSGGSVSGVVGELSGPTRWYGLRPVAATRSGFN